MTSRSGLCYFRKTKNKGVASDIFTTIIKEKLREIEAYAYNTDKIVKFVEIYEYMANNTCWIYDDKYKEFRHMVLKKLKEYYNCSEIL